jgi:hypothetical protein
MNKDFHKYLCVGDKLVCIKNTHTDFKFIVGKTYEITHTIGSYNVITDERNYVYYIDSIIDNIVDRSYILFEILYKHRNDKIDNLLTK